MEFTWDDISKKISGAADYTVKKTEKFTAMAKLEYKIAAARNKLNLLYGSVGKMRYAERLGEPIEAAAYEEIFTKIDALLAMIEKMEAELAHLRNYRFCVACNAKIGNDMDYCPKCGTRQKPAEQEPAAENNGSDEKTTVESLIPTAEPCAVEEASGEETEPETTTQAE